MKYNNVLGTKYPIIQGAMAWISDSTLAAAVSEAGGLGVLSSINYTKEELRAEINKVRKQTDKPFAVNIMLRSPQVDDLALVVAQEKVPIVTTGAGSPAKYMSMWIENGIKVIPVIASCSMAKRVEAQGASAVIAEGCEAGGHIGDLTTMALVPQVVDAVNIPVIAAGGIADARGVLAAFALGAVGVQVGTAFLVAKECLVSEEYKNKVISAADIGTTVIKKAFSHPVRALKTPFIKELVVLEETLTSDELRPYILSSLKNAVSGEDERATFMAGQIAGLVKKEDSAENIIKTIFEEVEILKQKL